MLFVDNGNTTDPRLNLAIEEYLLRQKPVSEDLLLFYINEPSIIVGRYQNILEEVNEDYVEEQHLLVVRRRSGGGTVYHDAGNLNYSLITRGGKEDILNFKKFTAPVVRALIEMGVPAELGARHDILVQGQKISGNAIYSTNQGIVCHGTLLFNSDLTRLDQALRVKPGQISSKGIKSVRSQVANIREFIPEPMDIETFRLKLIQSIFGGAAEIPQYRLNPADWEQIHALSQERYMSWDWNFGKSPDFRVVKVVHSASGEINLQIEVQNGRVRSVKFQGDSLGQADIAGLEQLLKGAHYDRQSLTERLQGVDVSKFIDGLSADELIGIH